jgi:hypothetical protein
MQLCEQIYAPAVLPPGSSPSIRWTEGCVGPWKYFASNGVRTQNRPAPNKSLYRLSYPDQMYISSVKLRQDRFASDTSWFDIPYHMKVESLCCKRRLINYKRKGEVATAQVVKKYEGMEVQLHQFLTL